MRLTNFFASVLIFAFLLSLLQLPVQAGMVIDGAGEEATWLYNPNSGNLTLRIESGSIYTSIVLETQLNHFDTTSISNGNFLQENSPGFTGFGGLPALSSNRLSFLLFQPPPCPDCLSGTIDMGNIMFPNISITDIANNWTTVNAISPSGGFDSTATGQMNKFGVIAVPEPSGWILMLLTSVGAVTCHTVSQHLQRRRRLSLFSVDNT